jgi:hypothetical protein
MITTQPSGSERASAGARVAYFKNWRVPVAFQAAGSDADLTGAFAHGTLARFRIAFPAYEIQVVLLLATRRRFQLRAMLCAQERTARRARLIAVGSDTTENFRFPCRTLAGIATLER